MKENMKYLSIICSLSTENGIFEECNLAIALNSSFNKLSNTRSLNIMDVREDNATETIKNSLLNARFPGVTVSMRYELQS